MKGEMDHQKTKNKEMNRRRIIFGSNNKEEDHRTQNMGEDEPYIKEAIVVVVVFAVVSFSVNWIRE